ncbi:hypothetical protein [Crocinitomix catalasitica]|uniref:hypothetical protein n=1 Tax=Crocinitomix catalasitica TaxID=184607 RepID=UPI000483E344|nr:hypothetical protein [Crocinitomix catalasitica]
MFSFFKKNKNKVIDKPAAAVKLKSLNYPPKILVGWGEAISGNTALRDWFLQSDQYKELGMSVHALLLKDDARDWLMANGYAHLMAMINGVEGNMDAIRWLEKSNFIVLKHVALAGDGDEKAFAWLQRNGHIEFAMISQKIMTLKDQIEDSHNDVHTFGRD